MRSSTRGSCHSGRFTPMFIFGALVALLGVSVAPVQSACSLGCGNVEGSQGSELFKPGQTYMYNLETEMMVQLTGNDPQDTSVRVQAQVAVTAGANCEHSMVVRKFGMWTKVGDQKVAAQKLSKELEADIERPVRFVMKGQKIGKDICADPKDSTFSLNVKRGLISLLQGHPTERGVSHEYDVFGKCPITNSEVSGDATKIFLKRKDLTKCEGREHFTATGLVRSVFNSHSDVKSTPIMSGEYSLEQRIKTGQTYPEAIQLTEFYEVGTVKSLLNLKVESPLVNSVKSKVVSKLVFLNVAGGKLADVGGAVQKEIRFESLPDGQQSTLNTMKSTMKSMIEKGFGPSGNVQEFTAEQFLQLVRLMRDTKKDDLLTLFQQVKNGNVHTNTNLAKKLYFDALFRANSADSVEAISNLVNRQMDATEQKMAYMSLQFAGHLNKESLASIQKLMDANPSYEAYLVTGTLIHKYCEQFECTPATLKTIMDKFAAGLKCSGKMDKKAEHQIIAILKGLKNSEQISMDSVLDKIHNCYQESVKIKRVRVQSVKTMSAAVCHTAKGRDILKTILKEKTVDPEFRIHAYLGLIKNCPNRELIEYLQGIYNHEETNQLIGFLRTHIQSLKMTTDPSRQELRSLVKDFDLSKHSLIGFDFRKNSFNYEQSFNLEALGVGGSVDSSVIFTKNGFLPRSMNFNFSTEVFGRDYNFLELELRQENLEAIGEKFFGPRGYFATKKNQEIVNEFETSLDKVKADTSFNSDKFNYRRRRRDAINLKDDTTKFNKALHNTDQDLNTDLDLDLSVNMFGSEVKFLALSENEFFKDASSDVVKGMTKAFNDALDKAKNWENSLEAYHLLMDTEFEYPTGIGIPLKARAQVSMATKFGAKLQFDLRDFMFSKNPSNDLKFQIEMNPSLSVSAQTGLYMDMGFQRLGMQLNGNLYSSVNGALDFKVQEKGHKWNMDFRMKEKKQEFVKFDHKIIFVQQEKGSLPTETALKFHAKKKDFQACFDQLYPHIGVTFCADYSFTMAENKGSTGWTALSNLVSAPLNGPNRLGLWVDMDTEYNFQMLFQSSPNMHSAEFMMDCPHPKFNRMVKIRAEAGMQPKMYVKLALQSPMRSSSVELGYKNDNQEVVLYGTAVDDKLTYEAKMGFKKAGGEEYTPIFMVVYPDRTQKSLFGYTVDGKIFVKQSGAQTTYTFQNLEIRQTVDGQKTSGEPFVVNGNVVYVPVSFVVDMKTEHGGNRMSVKGKLALDFPHNFLIEFTTDSNNQDLNGEFHYDVQYKKNELFSQLLKFKSGNKKDYDVFMSQLLTLDKAILEDKKTEDWFNAITKFEVKSSFTPAHPVNFGVLYVNEKNMKYENGINFKCSNVDFNSQFHLKKTEKMDYEMTYDITMNKFFVKVLSKLNTDGSTNDLNKRVFVNKVQLSNGFTFDLNGNFHHKLKTGDFDLDFENRLMDGAKKPQYKIGFNLKNAPKQLVWNLIVNILNQPTDVLTGKFTLKKDEQFMLEMLLRDILQLNTEFKFTELKVGKEKLPQVKGDGFVLLKFPKVNNYQMKANTKFSVGQPNYDVNVELLYDFERDNTKKAIFNTANVVKKNEYHTKNSLEILGSTYQMNGNFQQTGEADNGLLKLDGQIILPSTRTFSADFKRKVDKHVIKDTDSSFSGNIELTLKDQNPEHGLRTIAVTGKLAEMHPRQNKLDVAYKIELINYDRSNIVFEPTVKTDQGNQMNLGLTVYGKMLPEKFVSSLAVKNELKTTDQVNYDLKATYGKSADLSSVGHFKLTPGGTNFDYKIFSKLNVDKMQLQKTIKQAAQMTLFQSVELNLQGKSSGKIQQNFEWHFVNEANVNGNTRYFANFDFIGNMDSFFNTKVSVLAEPYDKSPYTLETSYIIKKDVKLKEAGEAHEDPSAFEKTPVFQFFKNGGEFLAKLNFRAKEEVKLNVLLDKSQSNMHMLTGHLTSTLATLKDHKAVIQVSRFDATSFTNVHLGVAADYYKDGTAWYKTKLLMDSNPDAPVFEAELDNLHMKLKSSVKFSSKVNREANQFFSELVMVNFPVVKFDFHGKMDWSNYQLVTSSPLKLTVHVECPNWQLQGFEMTVKGNRVGQKATIEVQAMNKGKNVVSGQLEMAEGTPNTGDKSILLEGSGNLKWQDGAKRQLTFTLLRKKIGQSDRHMEFLLNGQLDKKNFLFELKILDGTTIARHSICMNGDQKCTNIELKSDRKSVTFDNFEHDFIINFDVRPLGEVFEAYYNNFGLTFNTKKNGFDFSSDFNLFVENKERKYQVTASSKNPGTTVTVTYPGRQMAMELVHRLPTVHKWEFDFGSTMWLNKQSDPNNKLELRTHGEAAGHLEKNEWTAKFEGYVQHPKMKKMSVQSDNVWNLSMQNGRFIDSKVIFDVFRNAADKITLQVVSNKEFKPNDLMRWDFNVKMIEGTKPMNLLSQEYFVSLKQSEMVVKFVVDYPEPRFINFDMSISQPKRVAKLELGVAGDKLIDGGSTYDPKEKSMSVYFNVYHFASKGHACVKATGKFVSYTNANVHVDCDHLATFDFDYDLNTAVAVRLTNEKKVDLYVVRVALDQQKFLDTQYTINKAELQAFGDNLQKMLQTNMVQFKADFEKKMETTKTEMLNKSSELQKKLPDFSPMLKEYQAEGNKLYAEIQADPTLKLIADAVEKYSNLIWDLAYQFMQIAMDYYRKVSVIVKEYGQTMWTMFQESIMPIINDFLTALRQIARNMLDTATAFFTRIFEEFSTFFGKYQDEFNKIAKQIAQQLRELHTILVKFTTQLRTEVENIINNLLNFVKETVDFKRWLNRAGELLRELKVESYVTHLGQELSRMVKDAKMLTPETKKFLDALIHYISAHLTTMEVHNKDTEMAELKEISALFVDAITSMYRIVEQFLRQQKTEISKNNFVTQFKDPATEMSKWQEVLRQSFIPMLSPLGSINGEMPSPVLKFKWSGLNYLTSADFYKSMLGGDWSRVMELFRMSNWIPPYTYQAQVIDGAHFMTFDGFHYTFNVAGGGDSTDAEPEGCYFVLAADSMNANFTVIGTFNNKMTRKLNSIIVNDGKGNMFELKSNDKTYYNNKAWELPVHQEIHAWRNSYGQTNIFLPWGITVTCERNLEICSVTVNGYYKNKMRGLLGNANDERVDELQMQNGEYLDMSSASYDPFYQNYQLKKFNKVCTALVKSTGPNMREHSHHHASAECDTVFKNFGYFEAFLPWFHNYKEACMHATMMTEGNKQETACTIARGFVRKLNAEYGIPAHVPAVCYKECNSDTDLKESKVNNNKLDLILLVDFNNTMYVELLPQLINDFKATLKTRDVTDLNLNVVGYNQDWKYPVQIANPDANPKFNYGTFVKDNMKSMPLYSDDHFVTKCGWLNMLLEGFWKGHAKAQVDLGLSPDAQAFQQAQQYPFRADAFKMIFIFRSDPLRYTANPLRTTLATALNVYTASRGIHMHLMAPVDEFTMTGSPTVQRTAKQVIGFNDKVVLQNTDAKKRNNVGATNLRANVQFKADMGTDMVLRNHDGNDFVFLAQNYQARNPKDRKVFVQTMVNAIGEQLPRWVTTQRCHCGVFEGLYERDMCLVKDSNLQVQSPKAPQRRG